MGMGNTDFVLPVGGGGGFFGGGAGAGLAAFAGGALGSLLFNGGLGYGFGGGGRAGCGGGYGGSGGPIIVNGGSDAGRCSSAELDALTGLQASVNGVGLAVVQGQGASNLAACQGFSGVVASNDRNTAQLQNSTNQGFYGLNTAVLTASKDNALATCQSTNAILSALGECCCKTQTAIHEEGEATRAIMQQLDRERLLRESSAKDAKIAALESQAFITASQQAQTAELRADIHRQIANVGRTLGAYRLGRIDERDGTAADGGAAA